MLTQGEPITYAYCEGGRLVYVEVEAMMNARQINAIRGPYVEQRKRLSEKIVSNCVLCKQRVTHVRRLFECPNCGFMVIRYI